MMRLFSETRHSGELNTFGKQQATGRIVAVDPSKRHLTLNMPGQEKVFTFDRIFTKFDFQVCWRHWLLSLDISSS